MRFRALVYKELRECLPLCGWRRRYWLIGFGFVQMQVNAINELYSSFSNVNSWNLFHAFLPSWQDFVY